MIWAYVTIAVGAGLIIFSLGMVAGQNLERGQEPRRRPSITTRLATTWQSGEHHIVPRPMRKTGKHHGSAAPDPPEGPEDPSDLETLTRLLEGLREY